MKKMNLFITLLVLAIALTAVPAYATQINYAFSVTVGSTTENGTFSFDSSIIPSGGGQVSQTGLLNDLSFEWNGIQYDETTANTGSLTFDASGTLMSLMFGTTCGAGECWVFPGSEKWYVYADYVPKYERSYGNFHYITSTSTSEGGGSAIYSPVSAVPEPASMLLLGLGLMGLAGVRRKFKN